MDLPQTITSIKDVLIACAAVATASIAYAGLQRWRAELYGKADFEAARELARTTYKLRDALTIFRSPFIAAHEFPGSYGVQSKRTPEQEVEGWTYVYKTRGEPLVSAILEFDTQSLEAEALWGTVVRERTDALRQCVKEVASAAQAMLEDKASGGENFTADQDFGRRIRAILSTAGDSNELSHRIVASVNGIEDYLRPHLVREKAK